MRRMFEIDGGSSNIMRGSCLFRQNQRWRLEGGGMVKAIIIGALLLLIRYLYPSIFLEGSILYYMVCLQQQVLYFRSSTLFRWPSQPGAGRGLKGNVSTRTYAPFRMSHTIRFYRLRDFAPWVTSLLALILHIVMSDVELTVADIGFLGIRYVFMSIG